MKVLLRAAKASYIRTDKIDHRFNHQCKTCGNQLNGVHVSRRMRSRVVSKFCMPCFGVLLNSNLELK